MLKKFGEHNVIPNRAANPTFQGLEQAHTVFLTPRDFAAPVCGRLHAAWGDGINPRLRWKTELLCVIATMMIDSNRFGSDQKPWFKTRPKYSDDASYRIRQNLQIR